MGLTGDLFPWGAEEKCSSDVSFFQWGFKIPVELVTMAVRTSSARVEQSQIAAYDFKTWVFFKSDYPRTWKQTKNCFKRESHGSPFIGTQYLVDTENNFCREMETKAAYGFSLRKRWM